MHTTPLLLVLASVLAMTVRAEVFTAMADMEQILSGEVHINSIVDEYVKSEERRLAAIKEMAREYAGNNEGTLTAGLNQYIANPVNSYLLIRRMIGDWSQLEGLMRNNLADAFLANVTAHRAAHSSIKFPGKEDLDGAATAILRLQDTYRIDTRSVADGRMGYGARAADKMNGSKRPEACFEVGRIAYNQADYYHTLMWMQEALNRLETEDPPTMDEAEVLEYLSFALYQQGNLKRALALTKKLARINPEHPRAAGNIVWYEEELAAEGIAPEQVNLADLPPVANQRQDWQNSEEHNSYERLCRGEITPNPKEEAKKYCYYKRDRPYLLLAPVKVEIVLFEPLAVLFRDAISDAEIEIIKELALPRLRRATVQNSVTGELEIASYRISKSGWLKEHEHPVCGRINRRIDLMTNLNMDTAEDLQVANYGLGGHYDVHFDHARKEEVNAFKSLGTGNRIATILTYMSDVEAGGATVFPLREAAVFPQKGSVLFWYNLLRDGEGDPRTRHAACPVLAGTKWVCNKWIHEIGQERRRPCNLRPGQDANEQFVGELDGWQTKYLKKWV